MSVKMAQFPALKELQSRPQWVCWHKEMRKGKPTKVPSTASTGRLAESNNPTSWESYMLACEALRRFPSRYQGIGYMVRRDITGIDVDQGVAKDGSIDAWARNIIDRFQSYTEYSPSGTGVHILVRGTIPSGLRRRILDAPHPQAALEMYCEGRYFTITEKHVTGTPVRGAPP